MPELAAIDSFTGDKIPAALTRLWALWERIPEPKTDTLNAYLIIEYGVSFAIEAKDLDEAQRWADLAPDFAEVRHDMGEVEYLMGRVAYERGDLDTAKAYFKIANFKSEGRAFEGQDSRYSALIR